MKTTKIVEDKQRLSQQLEGKKFFTDDQSNMSSFPSGTGVSTNIIEKVLPLFDFIIWETDKKDTYIVRRNKATPRQKVREIWEFEEELVKLYPTLADNFAAAKKVAGKPRCPTCKKNKQKTILYKALLTAMRATPDADISPLAELQPELKMYLTRLHPPAITESQKQKLDFTPREACEECVGKHLAQAYVLLKETQQGYPEHIEYAQMHVTEAIVVAPQNRQHKLGDILKLMNDMIIDGVISDRSIQHLKDVQNIIESTLVTLNSELGLDKWVAIGHLAEAADECLGANPEFANEIREERLKLMDDPDYELPIVYLLNKAKSLNNG